MAGTSATKRNMSALEFESSASSIQETTYRSVKTSLKSIIRDESNYQEEINRVVIKCNHIVTEAYQFVRLFCLDKYRRNLPLPLLSEKFLMYCIRVTGTRDNRGRKAEKIELQQKLETFYDTEFSPLLAHDDKHDLSGITSIVPYLASQRKTSLENNLKVHFLTRLLRFINPTAVEFEHELSDKEAKEERKLLELMNFGPRNCAANAMMNCPI